MALTRWRVRMEIEPGRRQTLAVVASVSAAAVICLGALLWSFINPSGAAERITDHRRPRFRSTLCPGRGQAVPGAESGIGPADRRAAGQPAQGAGESDRPAAARTAGGYPRRTVGIRPDQPRVVVVAGVRLGDVDRGGGRAVIGDSHRDRRNARPDRIAGTC